MIHLHDLGGLWRRTLIAWPDGRCDSETAVFWLQGPSLYADLRVPAGRPVCPDAVCLRDLDWTMLRFMGGQEGFFGHFDVVDSVGTWQRTFDYRPDNGLGDRGALAFENGILVERGIDAPYVEHWVRAGGGEAAALLLATESGTPGCLVVVGESFIYARGRENTLPLDAKFSQLVDDAASQEAAQDLFDCEISFGRRHTGGWRIERSSHCFREGATLAPAFDSVAGTLVIDDVAPDGTPIKRTWRVTAHEGTSLLSRWFGSYGADVMQLPSQGTQNRTIETCGAAR